MSSVGPSDAFESGPRGAKDHGKYRDALHQGLSFGVDAERPVPDSKF